MKLATNTPPITPEKRLMREETDYSITSQGETEISAVGGGRKESVWDDTSSSGTTRGETITGGDSNRNYNDRTRTSATTASTNSPSFLNSFPTPSSTSPNSISFSNSFPPPSSSSSSSRQAARLASLPYNTHSSSSRLTSPPQTSTSIFSSNHHSPNLVSSTSSRNVNASQFLLTVIPPGHLPHDPPHPRTSPFCSGYSTPDKFSRGTLIPLYPTLSSQLSAIAREYGLPSTGGLVIYLLSTSDPNASNGFAGEAGPRIGEEAWQMLWGRLFEEPEATEEEEEVIALASGETESFSDEDYDDARNAPPMPPIPLSHLNNYRSGYIPSDGEGEADMDAEDLLDSKGKSSSSSTRRASSSSAKYSQGRGFPSGLPSPISRSTSSAANPIPNPRRGFSSFSTASQPNLRNVASRQSFSSNQSSKSKAFPPPPSTRSVSTSNYSSKPLGGVGYGSSIIVGRVEFDIDWRRGGRSKWYENWVEGAQESTQVTGPSSNISTSSVPAIPSPSFQDFQNSSHGRDDLSTSMSDRSPQSSNYSPIIIPPSPVFSNKELGSESVPVPVLKPVVVETIEEPSVKELRELSLRDSATVFKRPESITSTSREVEAIPTSTVVEEPVDLKAIGGGGGVRGRRGAPEMRIRTASGNSHAVAFSDLGSTSGNGHDDNEDNGYQDQVEDHHSLSSRESSESPSPLPPGGSPRLSNIQLSPPPFPQIEDQHPYTALADSEDELEKEVIPQDEEEEKVKIQQHFMPLPDQSDRDLDEDSDLDSDSDSATTSLDEPTLTIPASTNEHEQELESIDDIFPSDEATWRSLASEPNEHDSREAGMIETTGLGIMGAKVEEMVATAPIGVIENLNKEESGDEAGSPPPQDDIADIKSLLQVRVPEPEPLSTTTIPTSATLSGPLNTVFDAPPDNVIYLAEAAARKPIETDSRFSGSRTSSSGSGSNDTPSPSTGHGTSHSNGHNPSYRQGGSQWVRPQDLDSSDHSTTDHSTLDSESHLPGRYSASISDDLEEEGRNVVGDLPPTALPNHLTEDRLTESNRSSTIGLMENLDDLERALEELSPRLKRGGEDGLNNNKGLFIQPPPPSLFTSKSVESSSTSPRLGTRPVFIYPSSSRSESNPYGRQISPRIPSSATLPANEDTSNVSAPEPFYANDNTPLASPQNDSFTPRAAPRTPKTASYSTTTGPTSRPMTSHPSLDDTSNRMDFNNEQQQSNNRSNRSSPQVGNDDSSFEPPLIPTPPPRSPALSAFRRSKKAESKSSSKNLSVDEEKKEKTFFGKKFNGLFKKPDVSPDMSTSSRFTGPNESPTLASREFNNQNEGMGGGHSNAYFSPSSSTSSNPPPEQFLFSAPTTKELRPSRSMEALRKSPSNSGSNALPPLPTDQEDSIHQEISIPSKPNTPARPVRSRKPQFSQDIENLLTQMNEINNEDSLDSVEENNNSNNELEIGSVVPERKSSLVEKW